MTTLSQTFGRRLRSARRSSGWTQAELAEKADLSLDMIGQIERGQVNPSFKTIEALCDALEIDPASLFSSTSGRKTRSGRDRIIQELLNTLEASNDADLKWIRQLVTQALKHP